MKHFPTFCALAATLSLSACAQSQTSAPNIVRDASFEALGPSWFEESGGVAYFIAKEAVPDAPGGKFVLALQGWEKKGSPILSTPLELTGETWSATLQARLLGKPSAQLELALYNEKGKTKLATLGALSFEKTGWQTLRAADVKLSKPAKTARLALIPSGPQIGARIEVDQVGLFAASAPGALADNAFSRFGRPKQWPTVRPGARSNPRARATRCLAINCWAVTPNWAMRATRPPFTK